MAGYSRIKVWAPAAVVSLVVHGFALYSYSLPPVDLDREEPEIIELVNLDDSDESARKLQKKLRGQVVDLGPENPDDATTPPDDARYLAERNSRAEKDTVAPGGRVPGSPSPEIVVSPGLTDPGRRPSGREGGESGVTSTGREPGADGVPQAGDGRQDPGKFTRDDLMITMSDIEKVLSPEAGSIDYLPDAARGEFTALNAKRYTYASFYNRIKKSIRFYWEPGPAMARIRWSGVTLETRIMVVIDGEGSLESVEVLKSCGYPIVDAAAIEAVRKSAPFYNVPSGLLDENGKLVDVWSFYITNN